MALRKCFWEYEIKWCNYAIQRMTARAALFQDILDTVPLGEDPKSRDVREICEHWIHIAEALVPIDEKRVARAEAELAKFE